MVGINDVGPVPTSTSSNSEIETFLDNVTAQLKNAGVTVRQARTGSHHILLDETALKGMEAAVKDNRLSAGFVSAIKTFAGNVSQEPLWFSKDDFKASTLENKMKAEDLAKALAPEKTLGDITSGNDAYKAITDKDEKASVDTKLAEQFKGKKAADITPEELTKAVGEARKAHTDGIDRKKDEELTGSIKADADFQKIDSTKEQAVVLAALQKEFKGKNQDEVKKGLGASVAKAREDYLKSQKPAPKPEMKTEYETQHQKFLTMDGAYNVLEGSGLLENTGFARKALTFWSAKDDSLFTANDRATVEAELKKAGVMKQVQVLQNGKEENTWVVDKELLAGFINKLVEKTEVPAERNRSSYTKYDIKDKKDFFKISAAGDGDMNSVSVADIDARLKTVAAKLADEGTNKKALEADVAAMFMKKWTLDVPVITKRTEVPVAKADDKAAAPEKKLEVAAKDSAKPPAESIIAKADVTPKVIIDGPGRRKQAGDF